MTGDARESRRARREKQGRRLRQRRQALLAGAALLAAVLICAVGAVGLLRDSAAGDANVPALAAVTGIPAAAQTPTEAPAATAAPATTDAHAPTAEPGSVSIVISAAGDCTLGGDVGSKTAKRFAKCAEDEGLDYFLANVRDIFAEDDFTVVNVEGPLTTSNDKRSNRQFNFRGKPEYAGILSGSGVEVATLANNHALDYGKKGLAETAEALTAAGVGAAGYESAFYAEKDGVRVCFLSYTEWGYTTDEIAERVRAARGNCDILIVSMHWGEELRAKATSSQRKYGRAIVDAGADLVLGSHPHVVGGLELYNGKYIVYSLGNFCFGGNGNPKDKDTMIFQQTFLFDEEGGLRDGGINIIPCSISSAASSNDFRPTPMEREAALKVVRKMAEHSSVEAGDLLWMEGFIGNSKP